MSPESLTTLRHRVNEHTNHLTADCILPFFLSCPAAPIPNTDLKTLKQSIFIDEEHLRKHYNGNIVKMALKVLDQHDVTPPFPSSPSIPISPSKQCHHNTLEAYYECCVAHQCYDNNPFFRGYSPEKKNKLTLGDHDWFQKHCHRSQASGLFVWTYDESRDILHIDLAYNGFSESPTMALLMAHLNQGKILCFVVFDQGRRIDQLQIQIIHTTSSHLQKQQLFLTAFQRSADQEKFLVKQTHQLQFEYDEIEPQRITGPNAQLFCRRLPDYKVALVGFLDSSTLMWTNTDGFHDAALHRGDLPSLAFHLILSKDLFDAPQEIKSIRILAKSQALAENEEYILVNVLLVKHMIPLIRHPQYHVITFAVPSKIQQGLTRIRIQRDL